VKVTILTELWITESNGQYALGTPTVVRSETGEGVPGMVTPRPLRVLRVGDSLDLAEPPACGCTQVIVYDSGVKVLQHSCGRGWGL